MKVPEVARKFQRASKTAAQKIKRTLRVLFCMEASPTSDSAQFYSHEMYPQTTVSSRRYQNKKRSYLSSASFRRSSPYLITPTEENSQLLNEYMYNPFADDLDGNYREKERREETERLNTWSKDPLPTSSVATTRYI